MRPRLQSAATYPARSLHPQDTKGRLLPLAAALEGPAGHLSERVSPSPRFAGPRPALRLLRNTTLATAQGAPNSPLAARAAPLSAGIHPAFDSAPGPSPVWPRPSPGRHTAVLLCVSLAGHLPAPPPGRGANGLVAPQQMATWHCGSTPENPRG